MSLNKKFSSFIILFYIFIFLASFNSNSYTFSALGSLAMLTIFTSFAFYFVVKTVKTKKIEAFTLEIATKTALFITVMLLGLSNNTNQRSIAAIVQFLFVMVFYMSVSKLVFNELRIKTARKMSIIMLFALPLFSNITLIAAHVAFCLFFIILDKSHKFSNTVYITFGLYLIYISGARAVFAVFALALVTYLLWHKITKRRLTYIAYFTAVIIALVLAVFIYSNLRDWEHYYTVNNYVYQYTGQNILTGRDVIWSTLIEEIKLSPILGRGTGILPRDITPIHQSSHNSYVQIALQNGLLGLSLFVSILYTVWKTYYPTKDLYTTRLSASFFIGILAYSSFEVILTQNKMETALMFWLIFSIGLSNKKLKSKKVSKHIA